MRLERLEATAKPDKIKALFDDGESLTVSTALCVQFGLYVGAELDGETAAALKAAVTKEAARERAVRILTATSISERELETRLVQKGVLESDAADAVEKAETLWVETYGEQVKEEKPYQVFYDENSDSWLIQGTLRANSVGGVANFLAEGKTGKVLAVWHEK